MDTDSELHYLREELRLREVKIAEQMLIISVLQNDLLDLKQRTDYKEESGYENLPGMPSSGRD